MLEVQNDIKAMSEIYRVLKPGGFAVMQVPFFSPVPEITFEDASITSPREREKAFGQDDHVRMFGKDYAKRIERSGLRAEASRFAYELNEAKAQRNGLVRNEILYIGIKKIQNS